MSKDTSDNQEITAAWTMNMAIAMFVRLHIETAMFVNRYIETAHACTHIYGSTSCHDFLGAHIIGYNNTCVYVYVFTWDKTRFANNCCALGIFYIYMSGVTIDVYIYLSCVGDSAVAIITAPPLVCDQYNSSYYSNLHD